jgi:hypothetical protein
MDMHYDNPMNEEGIVDNSGVRVYYTKKLQPIELGMMVLGDGMLSLANQLIGSGVHRYDFDCPSTCSESALDEPVTVIREYFHMHAHGMAVQQQQIRNGDVIRESRISYWNYCQNGLFSPRQPSFVVQPGDGFRTSCTYRGVDDTLTFGPGADNEMCLTMLLYYPAKRFHGDIPWNCVYNVPLLPECNASLGMTALSAELEGNQLTKERGSFGIVESDQCSADEEEPPSNVSFKSGSSKTSILLFIILMTAANLLLLILLYHLRWWKVKATSDSKGNN